MPGREEGLAVVGVGAGALYKLRVDGEGIRTWDLSEDGSTWHTFECDTAGEGVRDPVCGVEAICLFGSCRPGGYAVPPLPEGDLFGAHPWPALRRVW